MNTQRYVLGTVLKSITTINPLRGEFFCKNHSLMVNYLLQKERKKQDTPTMEALHTLNQANSMSLLSNPACAQMAVTALRRITRVA